MILRREMGHLIQEEAANKYGSLLDETLDVLKLFLSKDLSRIRFIELSNYSIFSNYSNYPIQLRGSLHGRFQPWVEILMTYQR